MKVVGWICLGLLLMVVVAGQAAAPTSVSSEGMVKIDFYTIPSQDVTLSFNRSGRVAELMFKKGESVKAGQVVARLDDAREVLALAKAEKEANDETRVKAQEKVCKLKETTYHTKERARVPIFELNEALLDWEVGQANVDLSRFELEIKGLERDHAKVVLEETRVVSPIDGVVELTMLKVGESAEVQGLKVMRIVNIDPLWIEVPVPFEVALKLEVGDATPVKFSNGEVRIGKVVNVSTVAVTGSEKLQVRVEVDNAAKTPAGGNVTVSFPRK